MNKERRGNVFLNLLKAEWKYAGDKRKYVVLLGVLFLVAGVVSMFGPLVIGLVFNSIQGSSIENFNVEKIVKLIFVLLVIDVVFWIFHGTGRVIERRVGFQAHRNFVNIKLGNILSLPLKWHKDNHSGDTIDKLNRSAAAVDGFASHTTYQISYSIIKVIFSLIVLSYFDLRIAGLAFLFSVFVIFSISKFDKRLHKQYKELNEYDNKVSALMSKCYKEAEKCLNENKLLLLKLGEHLSINSKMEKIEIEEMVLKYNTWNITRKRTDKRNNKLSGIKFNTMAQRMVS